uniref:Uncharacterized protein n=1 Tax=Glossina pallidipes TaxID=7398 RepID=A0A1A9ZZ38_GLOPL
MNDPMNDYYCLLKPVLRLNALLQKTGLQGFPAQSCQLDIENELPTKYLQSSEETLEKRDCGREKIFQCLSSECKDIGLDMPAECITHTNANKLMCVKDLELIVEQTYKH